MGTRHLIAVYVDGEHKIAQYGQWDGYPSGQGNTVLEFLRGVDLEKFRGAVRNCYWLEDRDIKRLWAPFDPEGTGWVSMEASEKFQQEYPQLHRSTGASVLDCVYRHDGLGLQDTLDFAKDGLFCEWAYVVDLDTNTFEVYEGFRKAGCVGRFTAMDDPAEEYRPVSLIATYPLNNLPTEAEFLELENADA